MSEPAAPQAKLGTKDREPAPPCTMVIFGATGDLTRRLLVPALYNLARWRLLPDEFKLVCLGRQDISGEELTGRLRKAMADFAVQRSVSDTPAPIDEAALDRVIGNLHYMRGDATDPDFHRAIGEHIDGNAVFYLAVAANLFGPIIDVLGESGLVDETKGWRRVVIEKPFGHDLETARALNARVLKVLREDQTFRIDHFLGKETVQNIMAFRFGNGLFEPLWNRDRIDHVQISVAETVGVGTRGSFYDETGALRDMVPNHLFQLLTMIAMEPPTSFAPDAVRDRKQDVLSAVNSFTEDVESRVVRGQYGSGTVRGKPVANYRDEPRVDPASTTETYVAMRLEIDNWRWAGVPFYLRTGKSMTARDTEIAIRFKEPPLSLFRDTSAHNSMIANWLIMQMQPDEGISLQFGAKVPGPDVKLDCVTMGFLYSDYFAAEPATGYETLIYDAMIGDVTLFQRADNIEEGWRVVEPLLEAFKRGALPMATYEAGTHGPAEADALLEQDGRFWRPLG